MIIGEENTSGKEQIEFARSRSHPGKHPVSQGVGETFRPFTVTVLWQGLLTLPPAERRSPQPPGVPRSALWPGSGPCQNGLATTGPCNHSGEILAPGFQRRRAIKSKG